ncbi:Uncharacterised protein [Segatella copri]|nr:Uncharacterised protein [Segatella copri]
MLEALHHVEHHLLTLLGNLSQGEYILTQSQWDADEHEFFDAVFLSDCLGIEALDEESGSV